MNLGNQEILFTRQRHEADKAGLHWDYRIVIGDKAYSWATKKELPDQGKSIILHEQPVHTADYALSKRVEIPKGQYGAGTTTLDWVIKGKVESKDDHHVITAKDGRRFLLKKMESYGPKQWLFIHLPKKEIEKKAGVSGELKNKFSPDLSYEEMRALGVLEGKYTKGDPKKDNFFNIDASMKEWPDSWHNSQHPLGWLQWYQGYSAGKTTDDDERQIKRWVSFKARHLAQLKKADPSLSDLSIQPRRRQALLNWGIAPGIDKNKYLNHMNEKKAEMNNKYLEKIAAYSTPESILNTYQRRVSKKVIKGARKSALAGAGIGAILGGLKGSSKTKEENGKLVKRTKAERIKGGLAGVLAGGYLGLNVGGVAGTLKGVAKLHKNHDMQNRTSKLFKRIFDIKNKKPGFEPSRFQFSRKVNDVMKDLEAPGKFTSKAEASKHFKRMAAKHHPDRGGSTERMAKINKAWDEYKNHPEGFNKLAFIRTEMLEKIAKIRDDKLAEEVSKGPRLGVVDAVSSGAKAIIEAHPRNRFLKKLAEVSKFLRTRFEDSDAKMGNSPTPVKDLKSKKGA